MDYTRDELLEAKRQIGSTLHKLRATRQTLEGKEDPRRSQITLATRRIAAFEIAITLIDTALRDRPRPDEMEGGCP